MARLSAAFVSRYVEAGDLGLIAARILRARDYSLTPDEVSWRHTLTASKAYSIVGLRS
jgi:hypothetical protein